jgi:hypothetical protein
MGEISPGEPACPPISPVQNTGATSQVVRGNERKASGDALYRIAMVLKISFDEVVSNTELQGRPAPNQRISLLGPSNS